MGIAGDSEPAGSLADALLRHDSSAVQAALLCSRVVVPVVARVVSTAPSGGEKESETVLVTLAGDDGRTAMVAFSSVAALSAWRAEVRPVPVDGREAAAAALGEGHAALVLDPGGPASQTLDRTALESLAQGYLPVVGDDRLATRAAAEPVLTASGRRLGRRVRKALAGPDVLAAYALDVAVAGEAAVPAIGLCLADGADAGPVARRLLAVLDEPVDLLVLTSEQQAGLGSGRAVRRC